MADSPPTAVGSNRLGYIEHSSLPSSSQCLIIFSYLLCFYNIPCHFPSQAQELHRTITSSHDIKCTATRVNWESPPVASLWFPPSKWTTIMYSCTASAFPSQIECPPRFHHRTHRPQQNYGVSPVAKGPHHIKRREGLANAAQFSIAYKYLHRPFPITIPEHARSVILWGNNDDKLIANPPADSIIFIVIVLLFPSLMCSSD